MELSPPGQWRCDQCASTFSRPDHLHRHSLTHSAQKSHICHFCGALFGRGDVLRRHWKSCKTRLEKGQEMPEIHRGGKHKRACDNCASIRKACNGQNPCSGCIQRERPCTYQRLYEDPDAGGAPSDADTVTDANTVTNAESQRSPTAEMEVDVPDRQEAWNLGPQNFYASSVPVGKIVYSRNRYGT